MNWIFALNEKSPDNPNGDNYELMAKVAVHSASVNAPGLKPHLIWNGADSEFTEVMRTMGVNVIFHRLSFQNEIDQAIGRNRGWKHTAKGAFLRLDIPELFPGLNGQVLYTDVDVVFLGDPSLYTFPVSLFAFSSEFDFEDFARINSGVMILDLVRAREVFPEFRSWTKRNLSWIPDYDQGAIREYFNGHWDRLDQRMNWKPYWPISLTPIVTHFHGPKPTDFNPISLAPNFSESEKPVYWQIYSCAKPHYGRYLKIWLSLAHDFFTTGNGRNNLDSEYVVAKSKP